MWVVLVACEEKPSTAQAAPPARAPVIVEADDPAQPELKKFLDAMLVTLSVAPPREPAWPVGSDSTLGHWLLLQTKSGYGVATRDFHASLFG